MEEQAQLNDCKRCKNEFSGNFCSHCGQPKELIRIDKQYVLQEIGSTLNFDRGFLYSIKELIIRPGQNVKGFILEDRNRLVKPILFIIICSLIYTVTTQLFHIEDGYINYQDSKKSVTLAIFEWVQENYGYANIIMGIFIAFWVKIFFKKYNYNFFEILILICFVMGVGMLIFSFFAIIEGITAIPLMQIGGIIGFTYCAWAIGNFFEKKKFMSYFKAFVSYTLGFLTFSLSAILLGSLIDLIIK